MLLTDNEEKGKMHVTYDNNIYHGRYMEDIPCAICGVLGNFRDRCSNLIFFRVSTKFKFRIRVRFDSCVDHSSIVFVDHISPHVAMFLGFKDYKVRRCESDYYIRETK